MRRPDYDRRVAVTGLGIISPVGTNIDTAWDNITNGVSGLDRITRWDPEITPCHAAGEVNDFDPKEWMNFKAVRRTDKNVVFGVAAAKQAMADSGFEIDEQNAEEVGVYFGSGVGGPGLMADAMETLDHKGAKGPNMAIVTACSTGTHNIGEAAEAIRRGDAEDDVLVSAAHGLEVHPLLGVEVVDLASGVAGRDLRVPARDELQPGDPVDEVLPGGVDVGADGADDAEAGDRDAAVVIGATHGFWYLSCGARPAARGRSRW